MAHVKSKPERDFKKSAIQKRTASAGQGLQLPHVLASSYDTNATSTFSHSQEPTLWGTEAPDTAPNGSPLQQTACDSGGCPLGGLQGI